jgi:hypothetical protein
MNTALSFWTATNRTGVTGRHLGIGNSNAYIDKNSPWRKNRLWSLNHFILLQEAIGFVYVFCTKM